MALTAQQKKDFDWDLYFVSIGVLGSKGPDGVIKLDSADLGILRNLLMKEVNGEAVALCSPALMQLLGVVTAMEEFLIRKGRK